CGGLLSDILREQISGPLFSSLTMQNELLTSIMSAVSKRVNGDSFNIWFQPISAASKEGSVIYMAVPNEVFANWIRANYFDVVEEALDEIGLGDCEFRFVSSGKSYAVATASASPATASGYQPQTESQSMVEGLDVGDESNSTRLNSKYTFQSFVVGSCNQFAHAAAAAVVEMPSKTYNPLYLYGGVGLGKTHLMHAIGHALREKNSDFRLTYISSEQFMNELINAIRYESTISFKE